MEVTEEGMSMDVREMQLRKAEEPTEVTEEGMAMSSREVQS